MQRRAQAHKEKMSLALPRRRRQHEDDDGENDPLFALRMRRHKGEHPMKKTMGRTMFVRRRRRQRKGEDGGAKEKTTQWRT